MAFLLRPMTYLMLLYDRDGQTTIRLGILTGPLDFNTCAKIFVDYLEIYRRPSSHNKITRNDFILLSLLDRTIDTPAATL